MVYLDNKTEGQEVFIPRNDGLGIPHTGTGQSYWEGYADGVEHQRSLLSTTAFTENGNYVKENGWSGITVNVPTGSTVVLEEKSVTISADTTNVIPSSGYDGMSKVIVDAEKYAQDNYDSGVEDGYSDGYSSGSTDGYQSGYTEGYSSGYTSGNTEGFNDGYASGHTDGENSIIETFTAITATTNGQYGSSANPLSSITVNVPSGETYNIEENRYVSTAHSGTLVIHPSSGYSTSVSGTFETGNSRFTMAIRANNYPPIGTFELIKVVDESDLSKGVSVFKLNNGNIVVDDTNWLGTAFNTFIKENSYLTGWYDNANEHYKVEYGADYYYAPFDVMSAVTVDINIPEYNVENDRPFTATSNGTYIINPSNGFEVTFSYSGNYWYFTLSGTPQPNGGIIYTLIYDEDKTSVVHIKFDENGYLDFSTNDWDSSEYGSVYFTYTDQEHRQLTVEFEDISSNDISIEHNNCSMQYDVMSAVSLNVNVQQVNNYENKAVTATTNGTMVITASTIWSVPYSIVYENYRRYARFVIEGVAPQNYNNSLYRIDWSGREGYGFLLVKFNSNGDELVIDDSNFNTSAYSYTFYYNQNADAYDFQTTNFSTPTPLSTGATYDAMSAVTLTVNVPQTGYTQEDLDDAYASGETVGENTIIATFSSMTATTNGVYGSSAQPLSSITVNVPQTGSSATLGVGSFSANGTYSASTDNLDGYSAITINVPTSVISLVDSIFTQSMSWDRTKYIDTKVTATTATTMRIGYVGAGIGSDRVIGYDWMDSGHYNQGWRYFNGYQDTNTVDLNTSRKQGGSPTRQSGVEYDITLGNNYLYDNINESYIVEQGDVQSSLTPISIRVDVGSQKVKFVEIKDNGVTVFEGQAAIDSDGNIGLYDSVSMSMVYNSGLTMAYEGTPTPIPSQDYQSGYTDGQNSIISTFTAMTATTNGVYGSSANPMSSITVNVPQSGMNINTLATRNYSISNPSISTNVSMSAFQNASGVTGQLTLTDAVNQIFEQAFYYSGINSIVWPSETCYIRGKNVFSFSRLQGELVIPQNIVFNGTNGTFANCTGLTSIVFYVSSGNSGIIEADTFANCTNVTAVTLYNCNNWINSGAFYNCASLAVINSYSSTAPSLGSDTFEEIPSNGTVHYPSGSDYSSWQNYQYLSGWTFIGDL